MFYTRVISTEEGQFEFKRMSYKISKIWYYRNTGAIFSMYRGKYKYLSEVLA